MTEADFTFTLTKVLTEKQLEEVKNAIKALELTLQLRGTIITPRPPRPQ